jgi:dolichyl-phosphate beta-glucosyltransferase
VSEQCYRESVSDQPPEISVVIPCYNEERNLAKGALHEVHEYLRQQPFCWEVIVVNDESTDNSRGLIECFIENWDGFQLIDIPHGGKPAAVWAGIQKSLGRVVLFADMDQSTPITELAKLLPWYDQGFDVVIGSRGVTRTGFTLLRKVGSIAFRQLRRTLLLGHISDTQCGFKSCRRQAALRVFPQLQAFRQANRPKGWKVSAYDVEMLYLLERAGYHIKEVEVDWCNRDESSTKNQQGTMCQYLDESLDMMREVLRVKLNQMKGLYD